MVSGLHLDDVGVGTCAVAVIRSYPIIIDRTRSEPGNIVTRHVADIQILIARHVIHKRTVRGHVQPVTCRSTYIAPVRGEAAGSHAGRLLRPWSRWRRRWRSCRCCGRCSCWRWRGAGRRHLEFADTRKPARAAGYGIILVGMPESEIVDRIDSRHAVVPPTSAGMGLVTAAGSHDGFALTQIIERIRCQPASVADGRLLRRARGRVTNGRIPILMPSDAGNP